MKNLLKYSWILILIISCGGSDDDPTPINNAPSSFIISVSAIGNNEASLSWTDATDSDGDNITYSIQQGLTSVNDLTQTNYTFTNLDQNTSYIGSVTASDGNGGETSVSYSYTTTNESNGNSGSYTIPNGLEDYYSDIDFTKTGNDLFLDLSNTITTTHSGIPYTSSSTDVWDACKQADEDPNISSNVLLIYGYNDNDGIASTDRTRNKADQDVGGGDTGKWNREHVFAKSLANPKLTTDDPGPGTDVHNLRPADSQRNSSRSSRKFTDGSGDSGIISSDGGWYPGDEWKGDVARIVMYMYTRYHGAGNQMSETNCFPINVGIGTTLTSDSKMIDLFLKWNIEDPVSNFEANRNNVLAGIQKNRNPFIDNPYLATAIWGGDNAENKW